MGGEHTPIGKDGTVDISPSARFCISEAEIVTALYKGVKLLKEKEDELNKWLFFILKSYIYLLYSSKACNFYLYSDLISLKWKLNLKIIFDISSILSSIFMSDWQIVLNDYSIY